MTTVVNLSKESNSSPLTAIATRKVLVIDDQRNARVILEGVVRCIDPYIEVKAYGNPLEAIEWARAHTPDLVLTDYKMREIDGIETIRRLRQLNTCADVPIVMVTVSADTTVRHAAFDAGVTDFLVKPYDHYECRARCRNLLILREQQLQIKDRTRQLESEFGGAIKQMRARERETIMFAGNLAEYHAQQHGYRLLRIACYARLTAEAMGLERDMAERIELASTLHDVGKIGIAEDILLAEDTPGESADEAFREHTEIGHRLLQHSTSEYLQMAADIALHHHERYDGKGYPKGLKGRDIPLPARIVAVAEAFDIMTSQLGSARGKDMAAALRALMARKGTELDPVCVEALGSQLEAAGEIAASYTDAV
jgi:two-component system response regulator RpfG